MNIKDTFLKLTNRTYPHGHEEELFHLLPQDLSVDDFGNLYTKVGENPSTMFTAHLDTATAALTDVVHVFEGDIIKTDGKSILGADDKAGVTVMLYMIENKVPGLYYFFLGEEVGCIGSGKLSEQHRTSPMTNIKKVISFDRRNTGSIITYQSSTRCCSDEFGNALADALNSAGAEVYDNDTTLSYKIDPTGLYTDSAKFTKIYPECTNISVGYYSEHTFSERQDIKHLDKLAKAACLVDWESLPIKRDPSSVEYNYSQSYYYGYGSYGGIDWDEYDSRWSRPYKGSVNTSTASSSESSYVENVWFVDDKYSDYCSRMTINKWSHRVTYVDLADGRLEYEMSLIEDLLITLEQPFESIDWDGLKLVVHHDSTSTTECSREELVDFIPELNFWKKLNEEHLDELFGEKKKVHQD